MGQPSPHHPAYYFQRLDSRTIAGTTPKNISLLLEEPVPVLASFYDIMSTAVYPELTERLAMKIGGEDRPEWVIERRWRRFAEDVGVKYSLLRQTLTGMSKKLVAEAHAPEERFTEQNGACPVIGQIITVIEQRARKVERICAI